MSTNHPGTNNAHGTSKANGKGPLAPAKADEKLSGKPDIKISRADAKTTQASDASIARAEGEGMVTPSKTPERASKK